MDGCDLKLAPGFRFHPTDEELVRHYLCRKCSNQSVPVNVISEVDIYKYDPWKLPGMALYGEKEWYFFTPRDRKYPNGSRPNRAAGSGYWKATGADKPVGAPKPAAIKKALVFYVGKAPKGEKTNWIMHEYRLAGVDRAAGRKQGLRLDDWVLCRIYNKKGSVEQQTGPYRSDRKPSGSRVIGPSPDITTELKPVAHPMGSQNAPSAAALEDMYFFEAAESLPRLNADSSCSEHVLSPDFTCEREVESQLRWRELERALEIPSNGLDPASGFAQQPWDPFQDMFMYLQKPF